MATEETKQIKIIGFYLTVALLALMIVWYKGCQSGCNPNCRDEFIPEKSTNSQCSEGATAEIVTEPQKGILCHCRKKPNGQ